MPEAASDYVKSNICPHLAVIAINVNFVGTGDCFESRRRECSLKSGRQCQRKASACQVSDLKRNTMQMRRIQHPQLTIPFLQNFIPLQSPSASEKLFRIVP